MSYILAIYIYIYIIKVSGAEELLLLQKEIALDNHLKSASLTVGAAFTAYSDLL